MTKDNHKLGQFNLDGIAPAPRGVPQIEVTFDVDENGIMNIHAEDKATKKQNKITITNNKGRLSKEEIEKCIREAEKNREEDNKIRERIEAKNTLESTIYNLKNSINDEKMKGKISEQDKQKLDQTISETQRWIDSHSEASTEEYKNKLKSVESVFHPIMQKVYGAAAGDSGTQFGRGGAQTNPTVDEVD